ncbi:hypothetical protein LTR37_006680 [Vermiconidia calcicola]|uniref:Uncharacterized protein n=1 Tax=Vermiconidia calcicola TaxID=1690605 RepID=A0ACC3NGD8_9PEZI|nr:hypothetical protein LTR37_006680 [Vermiconidia calcicola]
MQAAEKPRSLLGYHRILAPTASVRVSPRCLGAMNFGDAWKAFMGECDKETVFEILDYFYRQSGNFLDTSNNYQDEQSEQWIGEWIEERGVRDEMVVATKYTSAYTTATKPTAIQSSYTGNNAKSMHVSSLRKLRTTYIAILYVHW